VFHYEKLAEKQSPSLLGVFLYSAVQCESSRASKIEDKKEKQNKQNEKK